MDHKRNENIDDKRRFNGSNDTIFKRLFKNKEILCGYLKYFTGFVVKPEEVFETNIETKFSVNSKGIIMDLRFDVINNLNLNLEFQNEVNNEESFLRRLVHYVSVMHSEAYDSGSEYKESKLSVMVVFVNTDKTSINSLTKFTMKDKYTEKELDDLQIYIINIPKFINEYFNSKNKDDIIKLKLLDVLTTNDGSKYQNDELKLTQKVEEAINNMNKDAALRFEMLKAENYRVELLGQGREEGIKEGERANLERNIKTMSSNGFDAEFIAKALSLDLSFVKEILEQK